MRIIFSLLLAAIVGLALAGPLHAQGVPIALSSERLEQITEDAKWICWHALSGPSDQIQPRLEKETRKRGYTTRDKLIIGMMCKVYLEGASDAFKSVDVINRS